MIRKRSSRIVLAAGSVLTPLIVFYGLYVLFHGHYSPGGGFQAGAMLSAAFLLRILSRGRSARPVSYSNTLIHGGLGILIYAGLGIVGVLRGGYFLDYGKIPFSTDAAMRRSYGILGIEIGVCLAVMMITLSIYYALASVDPTELESDS